MTAKHSASRGNLPLSRLRCIGCDRDYPLREIRYACDSCGDLLEVAHDLDRLKRTRSSKQWRRLFEERLQASGVYRSGVWRYHELILPDLPLDSIVTKPEGNTNLYRSVSLERLIFFHEETAARENSGRRFFSNGPV